MNFDIHAIFTNYDGTLTKFEETTTDQDIGAAVQLFMLKMRGMHDGLLESSMILTLQISVTE